jgi:hypothetical protein
MELIANETPKLPPSSILEVEITDWGDGQIIA